MMNKKKPLELYVHIPFCARKCLYCDFLSFRTLASVHQEYIDQLLGEIQAASLASEGYQVTTIFIGGGTPSILEAGMMRAVVETIRLYFDVAPDAEITIEANPGTLTAPKLDVYRGCGINRLSMGLQSADNRELKALGRVHSFEEFLKSFERARQAGFWSISVDLMSALPDDPSHFPSHDIRVIRCFRQLHRLRKAEILIAPKTCGPVRPILQPVQETEGLSGLLVTHGDNPAIIGKVVIPDHAVSIRVRTVYHQNTVHAVPTRHQAPPLYADRR